MFLVDLVLKGSLKESSTLLGIDWVCSFYGYQIIRKKKSFELFNFLLMQFLGNQTRLISAICDCAEWWVCNSFAFQFFVCMGCCVCCAV